MQAKRSSLRFKNQISHEWDTEICFFLATCSETPASEKTYLRIPIKKFVLRSNKVKVGNEDFGFKVSSYQL